MKQILLVYYFCVYLELGPLEKMKSVWIICVSKYRVFADDCFKHKYEDTIVSF